MGLYDVIAIYSCPVPDVDEEPWIPPVQTDVEYKMATINKVMDELEIMRSLTLLDKPAQIRIRNWLSQIIQSK